MCDLYSWAWLNRVWGRERERSVEERGAHENISLLVGFRRIKEFKNVLFLLSQSFVLVTQSTEWAKECAQNMMELAFRKTNR